MGEINTIRWSLHDEGLLVLTLDDPNQPANTMNADYIASMAATVERLEQQKDELAGVIITSAKKTFFAGGDLRDLLAVQPEQAGEFAEFVREAKAQLRRLEMLGVPVVAAIAGSALGGGLEIALATHRRIVVDDSAIALGLPEVTLGLLPGGGGLTRTVRMFGVEQALEKLLLDGRSLSPRQALELGLVDELVRGADALIPAATAWIAGNPRPAQPWDRKGYSMPGGTPRDGELVEMLPTLPSNLRKKLKGANCPAPLSIMAAAVEGAQVDFDSAIEIEGRYMVDLATGQVAKNMIQGFFFDMRRVNGARDRPADTESFRSRKLVVLGAGMMGAGIAYVSARAGIEVVLKDVTLEAAQRGKQYSARLLEREIERRRCTRAEADALLARITPTDDPSAAAGADTMIEAVFEDPELKRRVYAETVPHLAEGALLASNTSSLPVTDLAEGVEDRESFIGLHFFSPVEKMPLLEIVLARDTTPGTLYRALDFAKQIRKTPIVVKDSRGFFTSRAIASFMNEAVSMLLEGVPPASIEQASMLAGYPAPALRLSDEVSLRLMRDVGKVNREAGAGGVFEHPGYRVLDRMIDDFGRPGKAAGAGFYEYRDGRRGGLWAGLADAFPVMSDPATLDIDELVERMLIIESLEAVKCLDEGVLESVADANVGSLLGIGFPGWTGGVLQHINGYVGRGRPDRRGIAGFVERAGELADRHGERFLPPDSLVERATHGAPYADEDRARA